MVTETAVVSKAVFSGVTIATLNVFAMTGHPAGDFP